jgi:cytochrome c biogenesis protein CcdA
MELLFPAFIAGILTILAPCILPLLPVIIGGSTVGKQHRYAPLVITFSLGVSIILFTLALRASTAFVGIPDSAWGYLSGGVIGLIGLSMIYPQYWDQISARIGFNAASNRWLGKSARRGGWTGTVLMGFALGPVFTSCSPTYSIILFSVLPRSYGEGVVLLLAYVVGLSLMMLGLAYLGQRFTDRVAKLSDPHGWFKRGSGILFVVLGILIATGWIKELETWLLELGVYDGIADFEFDLIDKSTNQ